MKRLYATTDSTEAELICAHLRDAGIESTIDNKFGADYAIGLPTSASPLGIYVRDEDAAEAAEILALHFEKKEEGEADPDAPAPLTAEESARFEDQVRRGKPRRRRWLLLVWFFPWPVAVVCYALAGRWEIAGGLLVTLLAFLGILWAIDQLAAIARKKKESTS